jgi:hypothetical protein
MRIIFCKFIQRNNYRILYFALAIGRAIYIVSSYVEIVSVLKVQSKRSVRYTPDEAVLIYEIVKKVTCPFSS